jgi:hypothetical protein
MAIERTPRTHRVVVLALAGLLPFELGIPHRIFGYARDPAGRPFYEILTCGLVPGPVGTDADFAVHVEHGPELLATADTVWCRPRTSWGRCTRRAG